MSLVLWSHPFSSFCQKVLVALYETGLSFEARLVDFGDPASAKAFRTLWPLAQMPVLVDAERRLKLPESTIAIEHLHRLAPQTGLLPSDPDVLLKVRLLDRIFDNYVQRPMQKIVTDRLRPDGKDDPFGVEQAREQLRTAYGVIEDELGDGRRWAAGEAFTLADCAAAPALFYADLAEPFRGRWARLTAYADRLDNRPSFARAVREAEPYRKNFPQPRVRPARRD
ncbi:MAG TPA: glutathione S-transferase family protein [Myxococcota bacterium]|nr:glutathione S-transferase family protein [Myxococcota bacterium]